MNTILSILQHALGRDEFGKNPRGEADYRNHYCVGDGPDLALCREAVAQGLMADRGAIEWCAGETLFVVTDAGKAYIAEHSPPPPKVSRGKARYLRWLSISDAVGMTFGEWLKGGAQ